MGTNFYVVKNKPSTRGAIAHIGKSSYGWLFLFHREDKIWEEPPIVWNTYEEVMEWLEKYTTGVDPAFCIMNEYDHEVPFWQFKSLVDGIQADEKCQRNTENFVYNYNVNGYRFDDGEFF